MIVDHYRALDQNMSHERLVEENAGDGDGGQGMDERLRHTESDRE